MRRDKDNDICTLTRSQIIRMLNRESEKQFGCSWLEAKSKKDTNDTDGRSLVNHDTCAPLVLISQLLKEDDEYYAEW